ncbi:Gfo/Idh/MocA family protein [Neorhodopirellula pilleata]|nr:Gfo/Idh/MocA family oxidoreductase [Neorhodopirellula pilleata]
MTSAAGRSLRAADANDEIKLGFIGCGVRGGLLMKQFGEVPGVRIAGLCDVDSQRLGQAKERFPLAKGFQDLRDLIGDPNIDAVVITTCNHWHCLAAIWAMQAGKDVYVEKPLSHSQWEGRQVVAAARKYDRICQIGTQQRSDPMQAEIKKFLHEEKGLGEIQVARVNHYFIRKSIGKSDAPLPIDKNLAYDTWLGPAQKQPIYRNQLHYDWHWDWNTGSGDMGNWGVHILDDVRNNIFQDSVALPHRILAGGGRVGFNDAGDTPNVHFAYFDTGSIPVLIGLSNLADQPGSKQRATHHGPHSGYIAHCQGGRFEGQRGRAVAFDNDGRTIREFTGNRGDVLHQQNFIDAVRNHDRSVLHAEVSVGNDSTGWCNLANVAFRAGGAFSQDAVNEVALDEWRNLVAATGEHLRSHQLHLNDPAIRLSPMLELDPESEQFVGEHAESGNQFLKREYRSGFEIPEFA